MTATEGVTDTDRSGTGPLSRLLDHVRSRIAVAAVDRLWLFPPRHAAGAESRVVVLSVFSEPTASTSDPDAVPDDSDRRRVFTARYLVAGGDESTPGDREPEIELVEHAIAPVDCLDRVIEGVLRRLDDDLADSSPRSVPIRGDSERWAAFLDSLEDAGAERPDH